MIAPAGTVSFDPPDTWGGPLVDAAVAPPTATSDTIRLPGVEGEARTVVRPALAVLFRVAVGPRADAYVPRFLDYERGGGPRAGWHWPAFLAGPVWAFYRKLWIAGIVFIVTFFVFLTPILIITLIIWYKVRKTRMLNDTMIRLAEKGVVPSAEALEAVAGGRQAATLQTGPTTAPIYMHAKMLRTRAAWSDLRKGIFCAAVGLGFTFYSMLDDGTPNFIGLVLLFVGLGYLLLWYFEDRQIAASAEPPPPPAPPSPPVA